MQQEVRIFERDDGLGQEVVFDRQIVSRYRYCGSAKPLIEEINNLKEEIEKLKQNTIQKVCIVKEGEAKLRIKELIKKFKVQNRNNIDIIEITNELNLPIEQVEKIMIQLEKEKLVLQNE
ncbi:MAG: hypothetical protein ABIH25_02495 [Candidatus Woesearchaeota archaeon]